MGRGGQKVTSPIVGEAAAKTVLIQGELYDVSDFKHPGGSIVKFLTGDGDATEAFTEFHGRSKKAKAMLKALPHTQASDEEMKRRAFNGREELAKDYAELRRELEEEGFFKPNVGEIMYRLSEIFLMHAIGIYLLKYTSYFYTGVIMLGIVSGRCGWLMHEGGHYSLTGIIKIDRFIQEFLYGVGCGMSAAWWRNQHNKHHATPQKLQHDVDLDTLPLVAFHSAIAAKAKGTILKAWLKLQAVLFIPVSCVLVALFWQYYLHPRHALRIKNARELTFITLRHFFIYNFVLSHLSWPAAIGTYLFYDQIAASYIFTNFALSHTHLPVTQSNQFLHWVEYAANHTTNIASNPLVDWWMAYLNFQIEHHLFPSMPQFRHPTVSKRVRQLFEKHGLQYDVRSYFTCLGQTLANLHTVGASTGKKTD
uniref:Cytochrome b5 heme-binding domain-containing protein n=1 Tax=Aureoumbra lagunensis TaxID=44058 RepID=A0A7S3K778_9STRA